MPALYLTPASLSYLAQLILSVAITSHLLRLWIGRHAGKAAHVALLTGFFAGFTIYLLLLFLETALLPGDRLFATYLQIIPLSLGLVCLIQFAYHFPSPAPGQKWERRAALILTLAYALWESWYALYRLRLLLTDGMVRFRIDYTDYFLVIIFLWAPVMLLRQTARASADEAAALHPSREAFRLHPSSFFLHLSFFILHLRSPQGHAARSARALALVYLLPFALSLIWLANTYFIVSVGTTNIIFSLGVLSALFTFGLVYLNYWPETTTFMVKVAGAALAVVLAVLSVVGWAVGPLFADQYPENRIPERQTLRFTPNAAGGYDAAAVPFHLDPAGEPWGDPASDDLAAPLPFTFPFYDQAWPEAYVSIFGMIRFGRARSFQDLEYRYGTSPGILPLYPTLGYGPLRAAQAFLASQADKVTITWRASAEGRPTAAAFAVQLILYPSGVFEITYDNIAAGTSRVFWKAGVIAGAPAHQPRPVDLVEGLPLSGGPEGIVHDGYFAFRSYLHRMLSPLAWLIAGSALLIIAGLPVFLHFNLVRPLDALLKGMRQVDAGDLKVEMPVEFNDEIGSLTQSFNGMAAQLRALIADLEARVAWRTAELAQTVEQLNREVVERRRAEEEARLLQTVVVAIAEAEDLNAALDVTLRLVCQATGWVVGEAWLPRADGSCLERGPVWHRSAPALEAFAGNSTGSTFPPGIGLPGRVWSSKRRAWIRDVTQDANFPRASFASQAGLKAAMGIPVLDGNEVLAVMAFFVFESRDEDEQQVHLASAVAEQLGTVIRRKQAEEALQKARDELAVLYEVSAVASRAESLPALLTETLSRAMEALRSDMGAVYLLDEAGDGAGAARLRRVAHRGIPAESLLQEEVMARPDGLFAAVLAEGEPLLIPDMTTDPRVPEIMQHGPRMTFIVAPLSAEGQMLGVMDLMRDAEQSFGLEEVALLASVADQVGIAVRSDHLRQQAAVLEERQRLARDLHDSVTQSLYGLVTFAEAGQTQLKSGAVEAVGPTLTRIGDTARQVLKEMRLFIHQLRPSVLSAEGLVAALHMRLAAVEGRSGIRTHLLADENLRLPPLVENELYQIALEALNNVLRHAQAGTVTLTLRRNDEGIDLEIADDGGGFDPAAVRSGGMGLTNMQERAKAVGAALIVSSMPGAGARIRVTIPGPGEPG